ncbi:MAG: glycosyltransferase [Candidatus Nealsonbacteria bacterium]|nr:glycosyltransferase [Candidatus Nealsonbacteria bacterium]
MKEKTNQISNGVKRVLFLVTQSEMGGAQRYIFELARGLDKQKYEISVAAGEGDGELFERIAPLQVKTHQLINLKRAPNPYLLIAAVVEIRRLLKKEKPDVLFLCSTTAGLLGSIAAIFLPAKVVYRIGGWAFRDPRTFWKNWLILLAEKMTAPLKDRIIVNSEIDRNLAIKYKIAPPGKIIKIYNGIDPDSLNFLSQQEARNRLTPGVNQGVNQVVVGTVANFYKTKGLEYLIEGFARSDLAKGGSNLIIIGEGRERPKLETLIKKHKIEDKVILAGRLPDAYKYLKAFDVFALPSLKEGFPWIILEAMAAEAPIVATKVGALPEIIDDAKEGFLVEPKNSKALAEKIKWALEHQQEAKEMTARAKIKVLARFSLSKMIEATQNEL